METAKKTYPAVDLFKFICCILIIAIHTKPFEANFLLDGGVGLVTRFAVPYFFVASGFFFFHSLNEKENKRSYLIKYELRLLQLYAIWYVIHNVINACKGEVLSIGYYIRQFILPSNGSVLWFLPAIMFAVFAVYELSKICDAKGIFAIAFVVWIFGYCMSTIEPLFAGNEAVSGLLHAVRWKVGVQNGIFFGFPYIALSNLIAGSSLKESKKRDLLGIFISFCLLGGESLFVVLKIKPELTFLWLFAMPMTYFTMHLTLCSKIESKQIFYVMRKISTLIYVLHVLVRDLLQYIFTATGILDPYNLLLFFATTVLSLGIAILIYQLSKKKCFAALKLFM